MKKYDVIVIGSGSGMIIVDEALSLGLKIALVDKGPLGGTCPNLGCIPSKMLIAAADRVVEIQQAGKLGIKAEITDIDFSAIMERMRQNIKHNLAHMKQAVPQLENLDWYQGEGHFIADYTLEVNSERITGDKIFIASGSRPFVPPITGLDSVSYLTNETVLGLKKKPDSVIIIGGGYISVEYGHFLAAMGVKVTILEMADRLVLAEEPEISDTLKQALVRRIDINTGVQAGAVKKTPQGVSVTVTDKASGKEKEFTAQELLMAVGRRSNADLLKVENSGIELNARKFIPVNEYLMTNKENIYAVGDANGQQMFTHMANREAATAAHNALHGHRLAIDYSAVPHAVYSYPQIAAVGMTEEQARANHKIMVARARYFDVAKGEAMMETEGFAKVIAEQESGKILGCHIIGPYAPILIQEVTNAMTSGGNLDEINQGIHIHPSLTELIPTIINSFEEA